MRSISNKEIGMQRLAIDIYNTCHSFGVIHRYTKITSDQFKAALRGKAAAHVFRKLLGFEIFLKEYKQEDALISQIVNEEEFKALPPDAHRDDDDDSFPF